MKFEIRGAARIGKTYWRSFQGSWPFGKLIIDQDSITVKVLWWHAYVFFQDIDYVSYGNYYFRIHHRNERYPYILFSSFRNKLIIDELKKRGVDVRAN